MGPKKESKKGENDAVINQTPASFEDFLPILKGIQATVANTNSQVTDLVNKLQVLESKLVESEAKVVKAEERVGIVEEKLVVTTEKLDLVSANFEALQIRIAQLEERDLNRGREILALKANANDVQQRFRMRSIRVYNMSKEIKNSREAALYLYDNLFRRALTDSDSGSHPGCFRVIEYCHVLPPMPGKAKKFPGFNYILQFTTRYFKQAIFDDKKNIVDSFNRENDVRVKISHDYTYVNRQCLDVLHKDELVKKVTFRSDRVMFKTEMEGAWKTVTNPFGKCAADMVLSEAAASA